MLVMCSMVSYSKMNQHLKAAIYTGYFFHQKDSWIQSFIYYLNASSVFVSCKIFHFFFTFYFLLNFLYVILCQLHLHIAEQVNQYKRTNCYLKDQYSQCNSGI